MKAKVNRGGGFRGVLDYVLGKDKAADVVAGTMAGDNPRDLAKEFGAVRQLRPEIINPVWHCSLALPAEEKCDPDKWGAIANAFMAQIKFPPDTTAWLAVRHQDTDHDHIHIVASRIAVDRTIWHGRNDVRKAITATQALERRFGLTLTPGLGDARAETAALTGNEIQQAHRTKKEPPRQRLQKLIARSLKGTPGALELAETLTAAGVSVKANIAPTGRMNGYSFEIDGVSFKGSALGKKFGWSGLQTAGVTYEQDRDREGLERLGATTANRGERPGATPDGRDPAGERNHTPGGPGPPAGGDRQGNGRRAGAAGAAAPADRRGDPALRRRGGDTAPIAGRYGRGHGGESDGERRGLRGDDGQRLVRRERHPEKSESDRNGRNRPAGRDEQGNRQIDCGDPRSESGGDAGAAAGMAPRPGADPGRRDRRGGGPDWSLRFRQASAARRRGKAGGMERNMGAGGRRGARVTAGDRRAARAVDPSDFLRRHGYTIKRQGKHLSVRMHGDEVYRLTQRPDRWVWCDRAGQEGGDNIALARALSPNVGYGEAVFQLLGAPSVRRPSPPPRTPPQLPSQRPEAREAGREYLQGRCISLAAIKRAEAVGMLQYGTGGILFVGYDTAGVAQSVTKRATSPKAAFQQRDFRSSDKSWPAILPGDPRDVWIVEGGADALALQDLATRQGVPVPSVIVSGGANVLAFLERASVQKLLKQADRVTVAGKIKKSDKAQARADAGRQKQAERIKEITGRKVLRWWPEPEQGRDLAEQNAHQVEQVRERANRPAPRRAERTAPKFTLGASSNTVQGSDSDPAIRPPETPSVSPIEARRSARQGRSTPLHRPVAEGEPWTSEQAAESLQETLRQEQEDAEEQRDLAQPRA